MPTDLEKLSQRLTSRVCSGRAGRSGALCVANSQGLRKLPIRHAQGKNRQLSPAAETSKFYFAASSVRMSVWTLVRQLLGPRLSTCP